MTLHLNRSQQAFVDALAKGMSQVEAYKAAGYSGGLKNKRALEKAASVIANGAAVTQALARTRERAAARREITVDFLVEQLLEAREIALRVDPPQTAASVAATMGISKLTGLYVDRARLDVVLHKPAFSSKAIELSEDEWQRQFAPGS